MSFDILPVLQRYLKTTLKGNNHWAVCPFHQDKKPSLSISEEKNMFKCFACNVSGDAVGFIMRIEKCDRFNAIKKIGEILNINVSKYLSGTENQLHDLYKLNNFVCDIYHKYLFNEREDSKKAMDYLMNKRKLSLETINKYRIGYAPSEDILEPILQVHNKEKKISPETIKKSRIFNYSNDGKAFPFFKNRIMFPILNAGKNVIGFSGRGEDPKYLNTGNTAAFNKSTSLFNIENIEKDKDIYVFEGFLDLLKVTQVIENFNGVACMGGTLTTQVFPILSKYTRRIVLCFDNDSSGKSFTLKYGKALLMNGFEVSVVNLMDQKEKDIDEMIDAGLIKTIKKRIEKPIGILEWIYQHNNPQNLHDTQLLIEDCLDIFLERDGSLRPNINILYAKELINQVFDWYKLSPEYKGKDLKKVIDKKKTWYIDKAEESVIDTTQKTKAHIVNTDSYNQITNPLTRLAIQYQHIATFIDDEQMEKFNKKQKKWSYELDDKYVVKLDEIKWIVNRLRGDTEIEKPDVLQQNIKHAIEIDSKERFLNCYYNFFIKYLTEITRYRAKQVYILGKESWVEARKEKKILKARCSEVMLFLNPKKKS